MKFSRLFGSLLFILATPLVLLADGIKSDHFADGALDTNRLEHRAFSADSDEHLLTTDRNFEASLSDSNCATVDNDIRRVNEHRKTGRIKIKRNALRDVEDCVAEQTVLQRVPLTPTIDWDDDFTSDTTSKPLPEPASFVLLGAGLLTLIGCSRRRLFSR